MGEGVMLLTEREARKNWCPHSRVVSAIETGPAEPLSLQTNVSYNRIRITGTGGTTLWQNAPCIASECMAWRFTDQHTYAVSTDDNGKKTRRRVYKGYCGLAGRP